MTERESYIKLDIRGRENLINKDSEQEAADGRYRTQTEKAERVAIFGHS